ncbi:MAG: GDSL-type esterase/lipase family protein [Vicinamibacterales bacterium]
MRIPAMAFLLLALAVGLAPLHAQPRTPSPDPARFEKDIAAFEAADRTSPPPPGAVLFVGSSSITNWDVAAAFPALTTIRRGYGGSHVSDTLHFADRIIFPYRPKVVVFYAGDADVAAGKSARQIAEDTGALVALIHRRLPETQVLVIGTKPSPAHWEHIQTIREANRIVRTWMATDGRALFADVEPALLGPDGQPRPDFYTENRLNLNERGYAAWTAAVRPAVERLAARTP